MDQLFILLIILCALGSGAIGGVFFAFSNFVMPALARIAPAEGIHAMQAINVTVLNRLFLGTFMGTGLLSIAAIVVALLRWDGPGSLCIVLGGGTYVLGSILVTMRGNVPLNNALMRISTMPTPWAKRPGAAMCATGRDGTTCAPSPALSRWRCSCSPSFSSGSARKPLHISVTRTAAKRRESGD